MSLATPPRAVDDVPRRPPISVRCCNPGNLRVGIQWLGLASPQQMTSEQKAHPEFCSFITPVFGFRALARDLINSERRGRDTIRKLITRYAPPNENATAAYIAAVSQMTGIAPDTKLDLSNGEQLKALCRAIAVHEGGGFLFDVADLEKGVALALA